jgi:hypothetical protein
LKQRAADWFLGVVKAKGTPISNIWLIHRYNDIIVLDMQENMNDGKTFTFFQHVAHSGAHFDFVLKGDDDACIQKGLILNHCGDRTQCII